MRHYQFPNITPSRAAALVCRKRFHEEHIVKSLLQEEFSQSLIFGQGVHTALKRLTNPQFAVPIAERNIEAEVRRAFISQVYPEADLREADISRAFTMVSGYLAQDIESTAILGTEIFAHFTVKGNSGQRDIVFGAKFDALIARDTVLVIRDYKTGKVRDVDLESACIGIAVAKAKLNQFRQDYRVPFSDVILEYDYLGEAGLQERVRLHIDDVKGVWPELKARCQFVYNATEFPAEPGEHCLLCPLRKTCRPNQTVSMTELDAIFL